MKRAFLFMRNFEQKYTRDFLKENAAPILMWPLVGLILVAVLWGLTYSKIEDDKKTLQANALKEVSALSRSYAQYLTRSFEQIDQVSKHIKYDWESSRGRLRLDDLRVKGLFFAPQFTRVAIFDQHGNPVTSTIPSAYRADDSVLRLHAFHQQNNSSEMQIGLPGVIDASGRQVVHFSRRLESNEESFAGIVVLSIDVAYLTSFYDEKSMGKWGVLATMGTESRVGISRIGDVVLVDGAKDFSNLIAPNLDNGTGFLPDAGLSIDQQPRFFGWYRLTAYPLTALVGLSNEELLVKYQTSWEISKNFARAGSILLLLFAIVATRMSVILTWKKFQEKEINDTYRLATEGAENGFYMLNALHDLQGNIVDFRYVDCNALGAKFFELNRDELIGVRMSSLQSEAHFKILLAIYTQAMEAGFHEDEYKVPPESPINFAWARRRLARSGSGLAVTISDISLRKQTEKELVHLANRDGLTGLYNRHWLLKHLPQALERAVAGQYMLAVLFIDLDGFKNINDTRGHATGDQLLKSVAMRLQSVLRPSDHVIRLGGDEFVVVLEPVFEEGRAVSVAERINESFTQHFVLNEEKLQISASIGISVFPRDGEDTETLLKNADIAMYSVKASGKDHFNFFRPELFATLKNRFEMEQALGQALEQNQFILHYQPRVDARSGEMISMEALVRWNHPERGLVSPVEFIPIAEETGLILRIGDRVMEIACAQIADWKKRNIALVPVSINVSARQFQAGDLHAKLKACLSRHEIDAHLLEVEITESAMMGESNAVMAELVAIRELGIELLVDDFGTGYSSLSQLQRLDMDVLKVDRVFTNELGKSSEGEIFFKAIVSMAHALNMRVVAEGVETREQLELLRSLSCDEIQGYYISRPVPPEQMLALMRKRFLFPEWKTPPFIHVA